MSSLIKPEENIWGIYEADTEGRVSKVSIETQAAAIRKIKGLRDQITSLESVIEEPKRNLIAQIEEIADVCDIYVNLGEFSRYPVDPTNVDDPYDDYTHAGRWVSSSARC